MSTKIYDAYKLIDNKNNLDHLMPIVQEIKEATEEKARLETLDICARKIQYYKDLYTFYGKKIIDPKRTFITDKREMSLLKTCCINEDTKDSLFKQFLDSFTLLQQQIKQRPDVWTHIEYVKLLLIPCGKRVFAMTFGNTPYIDRGVFNKYFKDYHYQNQTDRPDEITAREWNKRAKDWDIAIGPDYIPAKHGFEFKLYDLFDYGFAAKVEGFYCETDTEDKKAAMGKASTNYGHRINTIVETIKYPKETENMELSRIRNITLTPEYKRWKKNQFKRVMKKLGITQEDLDNEAMAKKKIYDHVDLV